MKSRIKYDLDKFTQGQNFWNLSIKEIMDIMYRA